MQQQPQSIPDVIPSDVFWLTVAMLDASDLMQVYAAMPSSVRPPVGAVFAATRPLLMRELEWFVLRGIRISLLVQRLDATDAQKYLQQHGMMECTYLPVKAVWLLNGSLHRDGDLPAVEHINGDLFWYQHGVLHRDGDLPSHVRFDGTMTRWHRHGKLHRDGDLPAMVLANNKGRYWYRNGLQHRDGDRPAVEGTNGDRFWYMNGKQHRDGDRPAVMYHNGTLIWKVNGMNHRDGDQPAITRADGARIWYQNGKRHRDNGPAAVFPNGRCEWWRNNICIMVDENGEGKMPPCW